MAGAVAFQGPLELEQYVERLWTVADGMPQNGALALDQDIDGFLFIGTRAGLVRFDGVGFSVYDRASMDWLTDHFITALAADPAGGLWIGTRTGLVRLESGQARVWTTEDGLPVDYVRSLRVDSSGALWIGTYGGGLVRLRGEELRVFGTETGFEDLFVRSIVEDSSGSLWAATGKGLVRVPGSGDAAAVRVEPVGKLAGRLVRSVAVGPEDELCAGTEDGAVYCRIGEEWSEVGVVAGSRPGAINALRIDRFGSVWIGADAGIYRWDGSQIRRLESNARQAVWSLFEDRQGNLWAGSRRGLLQLKTGDVTTVRPAGDLLSVRTITQGTDGDLWLGSDRSGLHRLSGRSLHRTGLDLDPSANVRSTVFGSDGAFWIGTDRGLVRSLDGSVRRFDERDGLPSGRINVLEPCRDGTVLVGTAAGLVRWRGGIFEAIDGLPRGLRVRAVRQIDDTLWVGTETGLYLLGEDVARRLSVADGLPHDFILSLHSSPDGTVWLATAAGLVRLRDESVEAPGPELSMLADMAVYQILPDRHGALWACTPQGIWRVRPAGLDGSQTAQARLDLHLTETEGMANRECNGGTQPSGWAMDDGRLAFATTGGVVLLDPAALQAPRESPHSVIDRVVADGLPVAATGAALPAGSRSLELRYTAPTFLSPADVRFRYRLEGFEDDWVEAGTRRQAFFTNLDPGDYRFRVQAAAENGVWEEDGSTFAFSIAPFLFQRAWFLPGLILVAAAATFGLFRIRARELRRQQVLLETTVAERTRELERVNDTLENLVTLDELTGLANYRYFQEALRKEFGRARRQQRGLSLILVDVDFFKGFNDTYGHAAGDDCLRAIARTLRQAARRGGEIVARYGGEEFAVLLPEVSEAQAIELAERIRVRVEELEIPNEASSVARCVTVSAGVATLASDDNALASELFERSDSALYDAKKGGRNRVAVRRSR